MKNAPYGFVAPLDSESLSQVVPKGSECFERCLTIDDYCGTHVALFFLSDVFIRPHHDTRVQFEQGPGRGQVLHH
jgi:hypothetical protein